MNEAEQAFLAFLSIGVFSIDEQGRIWKHRRLIAGSHVGTPPYWRDQETKRAELSESDGYPTVMFSDGRKRHKVFAHRVVWMFAAKQDIPPAMQVNHKNGNRKDRRPANLEMVTASENTKHGIRVLGRKARPRSGEANEAAKLTAANVVQIRALSGKLSQSKIGEMFGVKQGTVSAVILRKSWAHIV